MIVYEEGPGLFLRAGELDVAGRRVSAAAAAYAGQAGLLPDRFDVLARRFVSSNASGTVLCGPSSPAPWAEAFGRTPPGPVLISGAAAGEPVRGAFRAAAEGARMARRAAYLLDPREDGLSLGTANGPEGSTLASSAAPRSPFVALFSWSASEGVDLATLSAARRRGIPAGIVWPVIAGWTAEDAFLVPFLARAAAAGAVFAAPVAPPPEGEFRRAAVEARIRSDPAQADAFFEVMHHTSWAESLPADLDRARRASRDSGLSAIPPRPSADGEPPANTLAAAILEERALEASDEHRASLLHGAVRWIDSCGRDLAAIVREGNFARAFPFERNLSREAEDAVRSASG